MGSLALRPGDSLAILLDGFVNRLQDFQFPSFLLFKLRGFELLPRWDFHPLFMPAFAGRTLPGTNVTSFVRVADDPLDDAHSDNGLPGPKLSEHPLPMDVPHFLQPRLPVGHDRQHQRSSRFGG